MPPIPGTGRRTPHGPRVDGHVSRAWQASLLAILASVLALLTLAGCQTAGGASGTCAPGDPKRVGHYYLNGVMEVGSELLLKPDGSFEFMLAYGALDQYGKGCWRVEGNRVLVVPAGRSAPAAQYSIEDSRFVGFSADDRRQRPRLGPRQRQKGRYEKGEALSRAHVAPLCPAGHLPCPAT